MRAGLHLDDGVVDAVRVEQRQVRIGVERLRPEDAGPGPGAGGEQLHGDRRVEPGLPADDLEAELAPDLLRVAIW